MAVQLTTYCLRNLVTNGMFKNSHNNIFKTHNFMPSTNYLLNIERDITSKYDTQQQALKFDPDEFPNA